MAAPPGGGLPAAAPPVAYAPAGYQIPMGYPPMGAMPAAPLGPAVPLQNAQGPAAAESESDASTYIAVVVLVIVLLIIVLTICTLQRTLRMQNKRETQARAKKAAGKIRFARQDSDDTKEKLDSGEQDSGEGKGGKRGWGVLRQKTLGAKASESYRDRRKPFVRRGTPVGDPNDRQSLLRKAGAGSTEEDSEEAKELSAGKDEAEATQPDVNVPAPPSRKKKSAMVRERASLIEVPKEEDDAEGEGAKKRSSSPPPAAPKSRVTTGFGASTSAPTSKSSGALLSTDSITRASDRARDVPGVNVSSLEASMMLAEAGNGARDMMASMSLAVGAAMNTFGFGSGDDDDDDDDASKDEKDESSDSAEPEVTKTQSIASEGLKSIRVTDPNSGVKTIAGQDDKEDCHEF